MVNFEGYLALLCSGWMFSVFGVGRMTSVLSGWVRGTCFGQSGKSLPAAWALRNGLAALCYHVHGATFCLHGRLPHVLSLNALSFLSLWEVAPFLWRT